MPNIHLTILELLQRVYAVSRFTNLEKFAFCIDNRVQFAEWAVEKDDMANYLGFSEIALFQVYQHHQAEGVYIRAMRRQAFLRLAQRPWSSPRGAENLDWYVILILVGADGDGSCVQDIWNQNVEQHHLFEKQLDATMMYLRKCRMNLSPAPSPSPLPEPTDALANLDLSAYAGLDPTKPFSPAALRAHMDSWMLVLAGHLNVRLTRSNPSTLRR